MDVTKDRRLHAGGRFARPPLGADRDVRHGRRPRAAHRPRAAGAGRGVLVAPARPARGVGPPRRVPEAGAPVQERGLEARWSRLLKLRAAVNVELEKLRQSKEIGQSLEAVVHLGGAGPIADLIAQHRDQLPGLFITSQVDNLTGPPAAGQEPAAGCVYHEDEGSAVHIVAEKAGGTKCDRCWRYVPAVSAAAGREGVCPRCEDALAAAR